MATSSDGDVLAIILLTRLSHISGSSMVIFSSKCSKKTSRSLRSDGKPPSNLDTVILKPSSAHICGGAMARRFSSKYFQKRSLFSLLSGNTENNDRFWKYLEENRL